MTDAAVADTLRAIERFLESSQDPVLCEPGEEWLAITSENFVAESRASCVQVQAWDAKRNLVRRVQGVEREVRGKLVLRVERFGKLTGAIELIDRRRALRENVPLRSARLEFREQFRRFLRRQFAGYKLAELTTEADLEHSLSPAYPRALLRQGAIAWAAIGGSRESLHLDGVLTFGLIWLDYLRSREPSLAVQGLILYLPAGAEKTTCLRLRYLDPAAAQCRVFVHDDDGLEERLDLADYGNLETHLEPYRRSLAQPLVAPQVESIDRGDGELSYRVHGLEFARSQGAAVQMTMDLERAAELAHLRTPDAPDRRHPLYLRNSEAWLESQIRANIRELDASLAPTPIYGQVPAFAAADRGVLDLLAVDERGRLAVIEIKASEDVHLPLQALDYWMRVAWHAQRREFQSYGYFPGRELATDPPRLLLVSPALDVHSSNERVLRYFSRAVPVECLGVGLEWRKELKVMHRT